ncbi:hypothetical protein SAMN05192532_103383 [Alteribacillus iranensis]|uniref:Uncharacterized protein n=1 Tax=Alteribacillus iranensis TaxID=930128 RepID=A0A1I2D3G7_9BACI|nr:hypothetical protein SAMN05192532_103383 [Alteribacillus iranensis]
MVSNAFSPCSPTPGSNPMFMINQWKEEVDKRNIMMSERQDETSSAIASTLFFIWIRRPRKFLSTPFFLRNGSKEWSPLGKIGETPDT